MLESAAKAYAVHVLKTLSAHSARGFLLALQKVQHCKSFLEADSLMQVVPEVVFVEFRSTLQAEMSHWRIPFGSLRRWYLWAERMGYPPFSRDVARSIRSIRLGPDPNYGRAVLQELPGKGPLSDQDRRKITTALTTSEFRGTLPVHDLALLWLLLVWGSNISVAASLRESDLRQEGQFHFLNIPRHKKGDSTPRAQVKSRRIPAFLAALLKRVISDNRSQRERLGHSELPDWPMFPRKAPSETSLLDASDLVTRWHELPSTLSAKVRNLGIELNLTDDSGNFIPLSARRFRYTFGTELVKLNASPAVVAEALDHGDTRHIMVYFNARSSVVERLDKALAAHLGPIAKAFLGKVVQKPHDAPRGDDPSSRVFFGDKEKGLFVGVGSCGCFGKCRLASPLACYTCRLYHPWKDGPHELLLDQLLKRRLNLESQEAAPADVQLYDQTILAIAEVISICKERHTPKNPSGGVE